MEKENKYKEIELRSEEVQEIMNQIPLRILRGGITILFIIVLSLIIGSWFFKYPDTIHASITITSLEPPVNIVARANGKIDKIYVKNNQHINKRTPLATIENTAKTSDIQHLTICIKEWQDANFNIEKGIRLFSGINLSLGDLQVPYAEFISNLDDYMSYKKQNYYPKKIKLQKQQLTAQKEYFNRVCCQKGIVNDNQILAKSLFKRDSILFKKDMISKDEYELSKSTFLRTKQSKLSFSASIKESELRLIQKTEKLLDLKQKSNELKRKYKLLLHNSFETLAAQLKNWEQHYLMLSPIDGIVNQMGIWSNNQNVNIGEIVFTVTPIDQIKSKGRAMLPVVGAGKVKIGQRVNIRINNFPEQEFGYLIGHINSISNIPTSEGFYVVEVDFPKGMKTTYGRTLPITQQMQGDAEIITDDLRLLERFFLPIKKVFKNQTNL